MPTASRPTALTKAGWRSIRMIADAGARMLGGGVCDRKSRSEAEADAMVLQSCVSMHIAKTGAASPDILLADRYTTCA